MSSENHKSAHDAVADARPVFTTPARPQEIPELLRVLPTDAAILVRSELCGWGGLTTARVSEYVRQLEAIIQRQAEGFFTVNEAAQVLADSRPGVDVMHMIGRIAAATVNGERMARNPGDRLPIQRDIDFHDWLCLVKVSDINAWLTQCGVGYVFPAVAAGEAPQTPTGAAATPTAAEESITLPVLEATSLPPLSTPDLARAFDDVGGQTEAQWRRKLGDANNHRWVLPARAQQRAAPNPSTWWPIAFAELLLRGRASEASLNSAFMTAPKLKPWLPHWQAKRRERNAFGQ